MALLQDLKALEDNGKKGDWCFINDDSYICVMWGDDPFKNVSILPVKPIEGKASWEWNGNREAPSLTPSILVQAYPGWTDGWHGYLTDGKLITV